MPATVSQLATAPVKGMRLQCTSEIRLGQSGVIGDREFLVIGQDSKLLLTRPGRIHIDDPVIGPEPLPRHRWSGSRPPRQGPSG